MCPVEAKEVSILGRKEWLFLSAPEGLLAGGAGGELGLIGSVQQLSLNGSEAILQWIETQKKNCGHRYVQEIEILKA